MLETGQRPSPGQPVTGVNPQGTSEDKTYVIENCSTLEAANQKLSQYGKFYRLLSSQAVPHDNGAVSYILTFEKRA